MRGLEGPNLRGGAEIYPKGSAAMKRLLLSFLGGEGPTAV